MFSLREFYQPDSIDEAYELLVKSRRNAILGGCLFLKLGKKRMGVGIDLSNAHLDSIKIYDDRISIGASVTLAQVEDNTFIRKYANGVLSKAVSTIVSRQLRNTATMGGSVYARYGFSDIIPTLLALKARVHLYSRGVMELEEFMKLERTMKNKDILTMIDIPIVDARGYYLDMRQTTGDYCILNLALSRLDDEYRVVVGARPQKAVVAYETSKFINDNMYRIPFKELCEKSGDLLVKEVRFGNNNRGSAEYRMLLSKGLLAKALREALDENIAYD